MATDLDNAYEFCLGLHNLLAESLVDVDHVRSVVSRLESHARSFEETRFCKGCVLSVVDQWANEFFRGRYGASSQEVFKALRCEGFNTLADCYTPTGVQTHFSGTPATRTRQPLTKSGDPRGGNAFPDFAIRFNSPQGNLRMVGEVKYSSRSKSTASVIEELRNDLAYYLKVAADPLTDWGHDFGYGVGYVAAGEGIRNIALIADH